jgi:hypothetical protein
MSTAIDNFTSQLHDNLEAVEDSPKATLRERAKSLKHDIKSAAKKNQAEIQSKLDEAKASLAAKKKEFDDYRAKLKTQFEEKEGDSVGINLAWRFLLDREDKIFFVGIDLLASPQELVELGLVR